MYYKSPLISFTNPKPSLLGFVFSGIFEKGIDAKKPNFELYMITQRQIIQTKPWGYEYIYIYMQIGDYEMIIFHQTLFQSLNPK